jgi:ADP-heptose:LPS heptosyltransferase
MTTPTAHAIKKLFKEKCELTYVTNTSYLDGALTKVLKYNPDVDEIVERNLFRAHDYDAVLNLHCPCVNYEKPGKPPINRIDIFARHVGIQLQDFRPQYYLLREEIEAEEGMFESWREPVMLVQPFASNQRRSMDHRVLKDAVMEMWEKYRVRSVVVTHGRDWSSDTLWDNLPGSMQVHDADVRRIAALMVYCDLVLCPDSSVLHLAGALEVPTVSIFGPTHPAARVNRYPQAVAIWEGEDLKPCPCWYENCPISEACWKLIKPQTIVDACVKHLEDTEKVDMGRIPVHEPGQAMVETEFV